MRLLSSPNFVSTRLPCLGSLEGCCLFSHELIFFHNLGCIGRLHVRVMCVHGVGLSIQWLRTFVRYIFLACSMSG
jgi:hypothetical protein